MTKDGYKKIENLEVGDLVLTAEGKEIAIKWVGIQTVDPSSITNPLVSNPVKIKAATIGDNIPCIDLTVSPNHAIYVEGLLINAGALVNDINIVQLEPKGIFRYYHVELDTHELIIAENTWSESYLPQKENRDAFDNAAEYDTLYPDGRKIILWPLNYPRISAKNKVPDYISEKLLPNIKNKKTA